MDEATLRNALLIAFKAYEGTPAFERVKHEPWLYTSFSDVATDLAPPSTAALDGMEKARD